MIIPPDYSIAGDAASWQRALASAGNGTIYACVASVDFARLQALEAPLGGQIGATTLTRCRRLLVHEDRLRFIAAHALLRSLCANVTQQDGASFEIEALAFQPPKLLGASGSRFLLSLSHAGRFVAAAVGIETETGIDVEPVTHAGHLPIDASNGMQVNSCAEAQWLESLPEQARARAALGLWCAKEALLKAQGTGFNVEPSRVDTLDAAMPFRLWTPTLDKHRSCVFAVAGGASSTVLHVLEADFESILRFNDAVFIPTRGSAMGPKRGL